MINTTDFISRCWKKPSRRWPRFVPAGSVLAKLAVVAACLLSAHGAFAAEGVSVTSAKLEAGDDGYQLHADFDLQLSPAMQEAVRKGVPLYFIVEFQLTQGRWYWLDQKVVQVSRDRRVSYAPLTEQYRVTDSGIPQNVANFDDVRRVLSRIRSWTVADKGRLKPGEKYEAALRFRLDTSQLPKPFQISVLTDKEWSLTSDWHRWTVTP